ncbi:branched-chain amino acid ABC transporter permease [Salinactinospora qingdaonensis]|uniref:Branched-chain amino acid ABC transporter permease n=1 Tax=Salinactinospora qingdaonensis TaxID=702744 RepID=A0ABP7FP05_9ACTN
MDIIFILSTAVESAIGPIAAVYALAAIGLNMHFGYTGLLNFGQVGFMLVGGYGMAVSVTTFGQPLWVGFLASIGCAIVMALLLGVPTLRLRSDYLAISTIAVAEVARLVYRAPFARDITGGVYGLQDFADGFYAANPLSGRYELGELSFAGDELWLMLWAWGLVALASAVMWLLIHSPWGRVIKGIREEEDAVRSLGKNVFVYKIQSLILGGVFGALAGAMIALHQQTIVPDQFMPQVSFYLWAILLLGGAGRTLGPVIGAMTMWFLLTVFDELLRSMAGEGLLPFLQSADIGGLRHAVVGLVLVLLIVARPQGIVGNRKEMLVNVK